MHTHIARLLRYGSVTLVSQAVLLGSTAVAVELFTLPATPSYIVTLTVVYVGVYFFSAGWVYKQNEHRKQWYRFVIAVGAFWILNAGLFALMVEVLNFNYLAAAVVNLVVLGGLRYLTYSHWVFRSTTQAPTDKE